MPPTDTANRLPILLPTAEQAEQFVQMLMAGLPSNIAITYFFYDEQAAAVHDRWVKSRAVQLATKKLQGNKNWQDMTTDERIQRSLDKQYNEMAFFMYSNNYATLTPAERQRADICRQTLEQKIAGMAGKLNPLVQFYEDLKSGRVKVPTFNPPVGQAN